jgi:hypothetical protein
MGDDNSRRRDRPPSLLGAAFKTGAKAFTTASTALKSEPVRKLRGGLKSVAGGLVGVSRFMRSNSLRGLLSGEIVFTENELNHWFARVEPPDGVTEMSLRCRPSRLVLVMSVERRLFGVALGKSTVDLPFEVTSVDISAEGGEIVLRLDRVAIPEARGLVRPIIKRLLSRAAADLLEEKSPLEMLDVASEVVRREGDRLVIDVGAYPPFVVLMNRELRVLGGIGGHSLFPFRAVRVTGAHVEEGRLVVQTRLDPELIAARHVTAEIDALDASDDDHLRVAIVGPREESGGDEAFEDFQDEWAEE